MFLRDWLHSFRTSATRRRPKSKRRPIRLQLERLEDRLTPAPIVLTAPDVGRLRTDIGTVNANPAQQYIMPLTGAGGTISILNSSISGNSVTGGTGGGRTNVNVGNGGNGQIGTPRVIGSAIDIAAFIAPDPPTTTTVTNVTTTFSPAAQTVTLSATVTTNGDLVPIGAVTFTVTAANGNVVGRPVTVSVVAGQATTAFTIPAGQPAGTYAITAVYSGFSGIFGPSTGTGTLAILPPPSATTVTNVSVPFTNADPDVTLTATVTAGGAAVNEGQVQFVIAGLTPQPLVAPVVNGRASITFGVPANTPLGNYAITAAFLDNTGNFANSTGAGTLTVFPSPTTPILTNVSIVYGMFGVQETLTAVAVNALGVVANEGFITFSDGGQTVTVPIINSLATVTLNIPFFSENPFAHNIGVAYGDSTGNLLPSISLPQIQQTFMEFILQLIALLSLMQENAGNT